MTSRTAGDKLLLLLGLGVLVVTAALPSTLLHLGHDPADVGGRPMLLLAAPCTVHLEVTGAQAELLGL